MNLPLTLSGNRIKVTKTGGGSVTLSELHFPFAPYTLGEAVSDKLTNPGFESGSINGWIMTDLDGGSTSGGYGVDGYDIYSGSRKFYFFDGDKSMNRCLNQTVTGLENGTYVVKAKTKLYNSTARARAARTDLRRANGFGRPSSAPGVDDLDFGRDRGD